MDKTIIDIFGRGVAYESPGCCNALGIGGLSSGAGVGAEAGVGADRGEPSLSASERCLDRMLGWRESMCRSGEEMLDDRFSFSF
jgi:hypothetical protein